MPYKKSRHNCRASNDNDMKLEPVTKRDKRDTTTSKKFDDDAMPTNYGVIVNFSIYGRFETIWKPDSRRMICNSYILKNSNLLSYKKLNKEPKIL